MSPDVEGTIPLLHFYNCGPKIVLYEGTGNTHQIKHANNYYPNPNKSAQDFIHETFSISSRVSKDKLYNFIPPHFSTALIKRGGNARMCNADMSDVFPSAILFDTSRSQLPRFCQMHAQRVVSCALVGCEFSPSVKTGSGSLQ